MDNEVDIFLSKAQFFDDHVDGHQNSVVTRTNGQQDLILERKGTKLENLVMELKLCERFWWSLHHDDIQNNFFLDLIQEEMKVKSLVKSLPMSRILNYFSSSLVFT